MAANALEQYAGSIATAARRASRRLAVSSGRQRDDAIRAIAASLREKASVLIAENAKDLATGGMGLYSDPCSRVSMGLITDPCHPL